MESSHLDRWITPIVDSVAKRSTATVKNKSERDFSAATRRLLSTHKSLKTQRIVRFSVDLSEVCFSSLSLLFIYLF